MRDEKPFKYRRLSPFCVFGRLAKYDLDTVDRFIEWSDKQRRTRQRYLQRLPSHQGPNDQFVDDVEEVDAFTYLYAEAAIVMLWRSVEMFRKRTVANALGASQAQRTFQHRKFLEALSRLGISESALRCAASIDELRCINNAVKHEGRVETELAKYSLWRKRHGDELGDLRPHYHRLRPLAERYIDDLIAKATQWWEHKPA
jgi:hypothetical protein